MGALLLLFQNNRHVDEELSGRFIHRDGHRRRVGPAQTATGKIGEGVVPKKPVSKPEKNGSRAASFSGLRIKLQAV